jgi:hypothetical protein
LPSGKTSSQPARIADFGTRISGRSSLGRRSRRPFQCRAQAYADLQAIRHLRNRIAHHEPVFTRNLADDYQRIHDMIAWRSPTAAAWMDGKQTVMALIAQSPDIRIVTE